MTANHPPIGRLALRVDGEWWRAFYAMPDTMERAIPLGSILMKLVQRKDRKEAFMRLMQQAVADMIADTTGEQVSWPNPPAPAPESERSAEVRVVVRHGRCQTSHN